MSGYLQSAEKLVISGDIVKEWESRQAVSRDASIFEVMPAGVISPRSVEDIRRSVVWATQETRVGRPGFTDSASRGDVHVGWATHK